MIAPAGPTVWEALQDKPALMREFLVLCERFDVDIMPDGPGTRQRVGLILIAQRAVRENSKGRD